LPLLRTLLPDSNVQAAIEQIERAAKPSGPSAAVSPPGPKPPLLDSVRAVALFKEIEADLVSHPQFGVSPTLAGKDMTTTLGVVAPCLA
jgi:hypothetical protein